MPCPSFTEASSIRRPNEPISDTDCMYLIGVTSGHPVLSCIYLLFFDSIDWFQQQALQYPLNSSLRSSRRWLINLDMELYLGFFIFIFCTTIFQPYWPFILCICTDQGNISEPYGTVTVRRSPLKRHTVYGCVWIWYGCNLYLDPWLASALDVSTRFQPRALWLFRREVAIVCKASFIAGIK